MASTYLTRQISTAGSRKKATISLWVKRGSGFGNDQRWFSYENTSVSNNVTVFKFSGDSIQFADQTGGSNNARYDGTRKLRDSNSWYHFLVKMDTTQLTNTDRLKVYINGELQSEASYTYPSQNSDLNIGHNSNAYIDIGRWRGSNNQYFDGCISYFYYTDGYAYDASTFGSTDATTGEWKINTSPSITMGTNGFTILKDGNTITDQSSNSNNFTVGGGTLTKTEDNPSNVFATVNPLVRNQTTNSNGNLRIASGSSNWYGIPATLGVDTGKFYWEYKLTTGNAWSQCGVMSSKPSGGYDGIYSTYVGNNSGGLALNSGNGDFYHDGSSGAYSTSAWFSGGLAEGDIIGVALDATNSKIWFAKNGTWGNSSNPSTNSGAIDFSGDTDFTNHKPYLPAFSVHNCTVDINFGNGKFGTTSVSSAGTNASGIGIFEYDVPTGYTALSTKGLNT